MKAPRLLCPILLFAAALLSACAPLPQPPRRVILIADGERRVLETEAATVGELLDEAGLTLEALDRVEPPETAQIEDGMTITVTRVLQQTETVTETIPFGRQTVRDASLPQGEQRLLQSGTPGLREKVYRITLEDGVEVERTLVQERVGREPQDEIILVGTQPPLSTELISGTLAYLAAQDAWIVRANETPRRLTALGDLDGRVFTLDPAGTHLLFTRSFSGSEHLNDLWLLSTVRADATPLPLGVSDLLWADWSPDGETIAWTTAEPQEAAPGWRGHNDLWTGHLTAQTTLVNRRRRIAAEAGGGYGWWGTRYAWSPDGERLAWARPDAIGLFDLRRGKRQTLARFAPFRTRGSWAWAPSLAWSPDGRFIATVLHGPSPTGGPPENSPVFDLALLSATDGYSATLAPEVGMWAAPVYHPQGSALLFGQARIPYESQSGGYTLCLMDADGSNRRCLYPPKEENGLDLPFWQWSPDGERILFIDQGMLTLLDPETGALGRLSEGGEVIRFSWRRPSTPASPAEEP